MSSNVTFEKPIKQGKEYIAYAKQGNSPVIFQLPRGLIQLDEGGIGYGQFHKNKTKAEEKINSLIESAKQHCKDFSQEWFGGRTFSSEYIDNKFENPLSHGWGGMEGILSVSFVYNEASLKVFDHFQDLVKNRTKNTLQGSTIFQCIGIVFKGTSIQLRFELKQIKLKFEPTKLTKFHLHDPDEDDNGDDNGDNNGDHNGDDNGDNEKKEKGESSSSIEREVEESFESILEKL